MFYEAECQQELADQLVPMTRSLLEAIKFFEQTK